MSRIDLGLNLTVLNNATAPLRGVSNDVKHLGENAQATANRLKAIQVVIGGILLDKTIEYTKHIIEAIAVTQGLDLRLQAFAGSAEAADKVMGTLNNNLGGAGFKLDTLTASWTRLRSAVQTNDQATSIITAITNDVSALGGKDENINNLSESFQRLFARGTASSREYVSILQQTGLTLGDLAKAAHTSTTQFESDLKNGFITAQSFVDTFTTASKARFGDFAGYLKGTVAGSVSQVTNAISMGISHIGATTDLNARVAAIFNNIAAAITKVMDSIDQKTIDQFFNWLSEIEPFIINVAVALGHIAIGIINVGTTIAEFLGQLPPTSMEFGIVGLALFGVKGFALGALLGAADAKVREFGKSVDQFAVDHGFFAEFFKADKAKMDRSTLDVLLGADKPFVKGGKSPFGSFMPTPEQIAKTKAAIDSLMKGFKGGNGTPGNGISSQMALALEAAHSFAEQLNATLETTKDKIKEMNFKAGGDQLGAELAQFDQQGDAFNKQLAAAQAKYDALKIKTVEAATAIGNMKDQQEKFNDAVERSKQRARDLFAIDTELLIVNTRLLQLQNSFAEKQLAIAGNSGGLYNAMVGSDAGQTMLAVMQQAQGYQEQIEGYSASILDIQKQLRDVQADPVRTVALQQQMQSLQNLQVATQNALSGLSAEGEMQKKLWQDVGSTIENDVGNGLSGVLQGTMSLADAGRKMFSDLIDMASKYIIKLLFMQAIKMSMGGFEDGGAFGGGIGKLLPFANGGLPQPGGNVKAFANGDILTGPTLFGLAGEAGDEAIMPLTRIGGKLGVRSEGGGGGDHYHITVQAIDTQSGMEFVGKHIADIDGHLQHRKRLNRGAK